MLITTLSAKRLPAGGLSGDFSLQKIQCIGKFSSVDVGTYIDDVICKIEDNSGSSTALYYHSDRQFYVRGLTDSTGAIKELYAYSVYGKQTVMDATGIGIVLTETAEDNSYGFTGRYLDDETGLWYFSDDKVIPATFRKITLSIKLGGANAPGSPLYALGFNSGKLNFLLLTGRNFGEIEKPNLFFHSALYSKVHKLFSEMLRAPTKVSHSTTSTTFTIGVYPGFL
jgi:hypothetical protein